MRIAFITYEYPPDIPQGGIATYVKQAAEILVARGNDVEIFCASHTRVISEIIDNVFIHRCKTKNPNSFQKDCLQIFAERNAHKAFDVIESPEIHANAALLHEVNQSIPLVVKLHMPLFIQMRLYNYYTPLSTKLRFFLGALRRGKFNYYGNYNYKTDIDYLITKSANGVVAPSQAQKDIIVKEWKIPQEKITVIPYPFTPPQQLLDIPILPTKDKVVTFIGKLNVHKGIVALTKVIPYVVKKHPTVLFRFIGNDGQFMKMKMSDYIKKELGGFEKNYQLLGGLSYDDVLDQLSTSSLCIFPSIWENFGLVCLEAMSAGLPVIGTKNGGMKEILSEGGGLIVDPLNIKEIVNAIDKLLNDDELRIKMGEIGRKKVIQNYNRELIGGKMEVHFKKTIDSFYEIKN